MDEDHLNLEIRRFLKKVVVTSQRLIENQIYNAEKKGLVRIGDKIELEVKLVIKKFDSESTIDGQLTIN